ncbi:cytochrome P450 [Aspergillus transmontanensis]|uniref:Cytochrome P450 n=1 Tax=Aspergillus transmontanensis TaxID=1034304 RepID=A0A5N6VPX9_9EURO|nr:cytochrome P450 [Aspergillus transmontanensis]
MVPSNKLQVQELLAGSSIGVLASSIVLLFLSWLVVSRGPPRLPILGNLHQAPNKQPWKKYKEWSDTYGPIISVQNGATTTIIISSWEIIKMHMARKNTVYSHRPRLQFYEHVTGGLNASVLPYGETWKAHRDLRNCLLKPSMTVKYRQIQHVEVMHLLHILPSRDDFSSAIRRFIASLFTTLAYGTRMEHDSDPEIEELEGILREISVESEAVMTGAAAITAVLFPSLGSLSTRWRTKADMLHTKLTTALQERAKVALQKPTWNWVKEIQKSEMSQSLSLKELSHFVGGLYEAAMAPYQGLRIIIAAIILFPDAAARVCSELDEVIGKDRLPDFADCDRLPWTNAFIKEAMRWRSLTPLGAPRAASKDDVYLSYRIPREATVLVNTYAIDHDERIFPDPDEFKPERWIADSSLPQVLYGFGQRGCPGRHMGQDSLFIATSRLLWAFNIESSEPGALDRERLLESADGTSLSSFMPEFKARFSPRSAQHQSVVEEQWESAQKDSDILLAQVM